jgi:hypothetical protein
MGEVGIVCDQREKEEEKNVIAVMITTHHASVSVLTLTTNYVLTRWTLSQAKQSRNRRRNDKNKESQDMVGQHIHQSG